MESEIDDCPANFLAPQVEGEVVYASDIQLGLRVFELLVN